MTRVPERNVYFENGEHEHSGKELCDGGPPYIVEEYYTLAVPAYLCRRAMALIPIRYVSNSHKFHLSAHSKWNLWILALWELNRPHTTHSITSLWVRGEPDLTENLLQ